MLNRKLKSDHEIFYLRIIRFTILIFHCLAHVKTDNWCCFIPFPNTHARLPRLYSQTTCSTFPTHSSANRSHKYSVPPDAAAPPKSNGCAPLSVSRLASEGTLTSRSRYQRTEWGRRWWLDLAVSLRPFLTYSSHPVWELCERPCSLHSYSSCSWRQSRRGDQLQDLSWHQRIGRSVENATGVHVCLECSKGCCLGHWSHWR